MAKKKVLTPEEYFKKVKKEDKDTIVDFKKHKKIVQVPSGSWVLDQLIGDGTMTDKPGGFPRGHITEIFGEESSGKTTIGLSAISQAQSRGELGILIDFEQTFHPEYAKKLGVSLNPSKFICTQPQHFQQGARQIYDMLEMKPAIIVVDSVAAMTPKQLFEGAIDEAARIGLHAQLMSSFCGYISKFIAESGAALIFLNQLRSTIKGKYDRGPKEESSGGRALKFYSSLRLKLLTGKIEKIDVKSKITGKKGKEPVNVVVDATVVKNKIDKPWKTGPLHIRFAEGVDNIYSIIELAINCKVIAKNGTFYTFKQGEEELVKKQGKQQLWKAFNEDLSLFKKLQDSLVIEQDQDTKEEYKDFDEMEDLNEIDDLLGGVADNFIEKQEEKKEKKKNKEE